MMWLTEGVGMMPRHEAESGLGLCPGGAGLPGEKRPEKDFDEDVPIQRMNATVAQSLNS